MSFGKKLQGNMKTIVKPAPIQEIAGKKGAAKKLFVSTYVSQPEEVIVEQMKKGYFELYGFVKESKLSSENLEKIRDTFFDKYGNPYGKLKGFIAELQFEEPNQYAPEYHIGVGENAVQLKFFGETKNKNHNKFSVKLYMPVFNEETKELQFTKQFVTVMVEKSDMERIMKELQDAFLSINMKKNLELPEEERESYDIILCSDSNVSHTKTTEGKDLYSLFVYDIIVHAELNTK
jgi:hypothetical protein